MDKSGLPDGLEYGQSFASIWMTKVCERSNLTKGTEKPLQVCMPMPGLDSDVYSLRH